MIPRLREQIVSQSGVSSDLFDAESFPQGFFMVFILLLYKIVPQALAASEMPTVDWTLLCISITVSKLSSQRYVQV